MFALEVFMKFVQINLFVCFFRVICVWQRMNSYRVSTNML